MSKQQSKSAIGKYAVETDIVNDIWCFAAEFPEDAIDSLWVEESILGKARENL